MGEKMKTVSQRIHECAVVPVVVLDEAERAVPTARALLAGGIDVMEITFRTEAAAESIRKVSEDCPDMLVGAGTVCSVHQCETAVEAGAKFIVSPGLSQDVVRWCLERDITVLPGCVTPSEIMTAMAMGLKVVKFFPANIYGGLAAMKSLAAPFVGIRFMPTGGVSVQNVGEFVAAPFVHAVGGSWVCSKADIAEGNYEKISRLRREARSAALGFEVAHIGINAMDAEAASELSQQLKDAFSFPEKEGNSSVFSSTEIEIMKKPYLGEKGHIAIRTNNVEIAVAELEKKGYVIQKDTTKYKNNRITAVYLKQEFGGFAVHLLQK